MGARLTGKVNSFAGSGDAFDWPKYRIGRAKEKPEINSTITSSRNRIGIEREAIGCLYHESYSILRMYGGHGLSAAVDSSQ